MKFVRIEDDGRHLYKREDGVLLHKLFNPKTVKVWKENKEDAEKSGWIIKDTRDVKSGDFIFSKCGNIALVMKSEYQYFDDTDDSRMALITKLISETFHFIDYLMDVENKGYNCEGYEYEE